MAKVMKKWSKKLGQPPGSLIYTGEVIHPEIHISIMDFDQEHLTELTDIPVEECLRFMENKRTITWINIRGIHDVNVLEAIGNHLGLHTLLLEDIMNSGQRSKLDNYKDHIYIVMRMLTYNETTHKVLDEQVSLILGHNYVISFLENDNDIFDSVRYRIRKGNKRIRTMGADYVCYALIDCIVDNYFVILEAIDRQLEEVEEALLSVPKPNVMLKIQHFKREIILLRKSVWPMRDLVNDFRRLESPLVSQDVLIYMQDVYDHTIQVIDTIESFRDLSSGLLDVYLSRISQHLNEIMKVLTIVATLFVPLTFIASLYGMNFEYMPELKWRWGYPATLLVMLVVAIMMLLFFRRKRWI